MPNLFHNFNQSVFAVWITNLKINEIFEIKSFVRGVLFMATNK